MWLPRAEAVCGLRTGTRSLQARIPLTFQTPHSPSPRKRTRTRACPTRRPDALAALLREVPGLVVSFRAAGASRGLATGGAAGQGHPAFTHKTKFNPAPPAAGADAPHEMDPAHELYAIPDRPTDPVSGASSCCAAVEAEEGRTRTGQVELRCREVAGVCVGGRAVCMYGHAPSVRSSTLPPRLPPTYPRAHPSPLLDA
jgi:hypothetical protein